MTDSETRPRRFLFLQGLASRFFDQLGAALAARGHTTLRINFNAGDQLFWRQKDALNYRGRPETWPAYVAAVMAEHRVTDLVLFGDCRPMHQKAIQVAGELRVNVHVVEEGYLRPDWVTLELGGVNGHSSLPKDPDWYRDAAARLPPVDAIGGVPSSFRRRALEDLAYNLSTMAFCWMYPFYRSHRPWNATVEYAGWAWRLLRWKRARRRSEQALAAMTPDSRYFLFPLQLDCDSQIRLHSSFSGMREAIETVLGSFAAASPAGTTLIVKEHPLDNGLVNWRRFTLQVAERLGLLDRLVYLEDGDTARLVRESTGVVTVNSTTGTLALGSETPVICLGSAIYNLQGLTFQGELDAFWTEPPVPDASLYDAFRRVLVHRCLIRGGFFSDSGLAMLVDGAVRKLESVPVAPPLLNPGLATQRPQPYPVGQRQAALRP